MLAVQAQLQCDWLCSCVQACKHIAACTIPHQMTRSVLCMWMCGNGCSTCVGLCWCIVLDALLLSMPHLIKVITLSLPSLQDLIPILSLSVGAEFLTSRYTSVVHCRCSTTCAVPDVWCCDSAHAQQHVQLSTSCVLLASGWQAVHSLLQM